MPIPPEIKAIETRYNGYLFRSRLEARWAIFFDAVGEAYNYEPEGFNLGDGDFYLPDFYLPRLNAWIEVKPGKAPVKNLRNLNDKDERTVRLASKLARQLNSEVAVLYGTPGTNSPLWENSSWLLPNVQYSYEMIRFIGHSNLIEPNYAYWPYYFETITKFLLYERSVYAPNCDWTWDNLIELISIDCEAYEAKYGHAHPSLNPDYGIFEEATWAKSSLDKSLCFWWGIADGQFIDEMTTAREARFEHGASYANPNLYRK